MAGGDRMSGGRARAEPAASNVDSTLRLRGVASDVMKAAHVACDARDHDVAIRLLATYEEMLARMGDGVAKSSCVERLVAAHERILGARLASRGVAPPDGG